MNKKSKTYILVGHSNNDGADHEKPIRPWNVDLSVKYFRSMFELDLGKV